MVADLRMGETIISVKIRDILKQEDVTKCTVGTYVTRYERAAGSRMIEIIINVRTTIARGDETIFRERILVIGMIEHGEEAHHAVKIEVGLHKIRPMNGVMCTWMTWMSS
jgi:hypothetical protein